MRRTRSAAGRARADGGHPVAQPRGPALGPGHRRALRAPGRHPRGLRPRPARHPRAPAGATTCGGSPRWCSAAAARRSWSSAPRGPVASRSTSGRTSGPTCDPDAVAREIEAYGGTVVHRETGRDLAPLGHREPAHLSTRREVDHEQPRYRAVSRLRAFRLRRAPARRALGSPRVSRPWRPPWRSTAGSTSGSPTSSTW